MFTGELETLETMLLLSVDVDILAHIASLKCTQATPLIYNFVVLVGSETSSWNADYATPWN